jgi:hypothetical protein
MSLIQGLLNQLCEIYSVTTDAYSDITRAKVYSNVNCRWQEVITKVVSSTGEERIATVQVWILPDYIVKENYELLKDGKYYKILVINKEVDLSGQIDHFKLYLA